MALPHNIERRLYRSTYPAGSYRGWDAKVRMWFIGGKSGAWYAECRDAPIYRTQYAETLDRLGAKLARIGLDIAA